MHLLVWLAAAAVFAIVVLNAWLIGLAIYAAGSGPPRRQQPAVFRPGNALSTERRFLWSGGLSTVSAERNEYLGDAHEYSRSRGARCPAHAVR